MPFVRPNLLDELAAALLDLIREQRLATGDRLPSARALSVRFGVATPTLREALRRLEATGIVDIRHGSGVYVRDLSRLILANPHRRELAAETISELLEAREIIEPQLARLAASASTSDQLGMLGTILDRANAAIEDDPVLATENISFHRHIAHCAGNSVLAQMIDSIVELFGREQEEILRLHGDRIADLAEHRDILAALRARDPERAAQAMGAHLEGVRRIVTVALQARSGDLS